MKGPIAGQERGRLGTGDFAESFLQGIRWHRRIEAAESIAEALSEEDLKEGRALGCGLFGGDFWAEDEDEA
jgi:hypothetical protein